MARAERRAPRFGDPCLQILILQALHGPVACTAQKAQKLTEITLRQMAEGFSRLKLSVLWDIMKGKMLWRDRCDFYMAL